MKIDVVNVLTEKEWYFLDFSTYDEDGYQIHDPDDPGYFDDNLDDWIKYWYSKGYRFVKMMVVLNNDTNL